MVCKGVRRDMITMKDIAKKAGVSVATVSNVLNNTRTVSFKRKERVLRAIEEQNYVPNAMARGLRVRESRTIGLILPDIRNPFFPDLARGCEEVARSAGYTIIMMNTDDKETEMIKAINQIREGKMDGLVIASAVERHKALLHELIKEGYPIVLAHRSIKNLDVDTVVGDDFHGAVSAVRHLISLEHRNIVMVTGSMDSSANIARMEGFVTAMNDEGGGITPESMISGKGDYQWTFNETRRLLSLPVEKRPTAIFAINDILALGVMDAALDLGLQIPGDLAVIGYDDLFFSASLAIQLSTVRNPRFTMGQQATRILIDKINGNSLSNSAKVVLPVELVIRRTCGAVSSRNQGFTLINN
jgi:DNA-binding LacI/PurR family transcriptional regulator